MANIAYMKYMAYITNITSMIKKVMMNNMMQGVPDMGLILIVLA